MLKIKLDLGGLLPENSHRLVCVAVGSAPASWGDCGVRIVLPGWAKTFSRGELELAALYLAARALGDHSAWAAYHLRAMQEGREVSRTLAEKLLREARTHPEPGPVDMAAYWRGRLRAHILQEAMRPALVRVKPPKHKSERERLRVLLEGKRVTVRGKTYHVGGLIKKLGGIKVAPWVYLVPRDKLEELARHAKLEILL